jgi:hypothetical protein
LAKVVGNKLTVFVLADAPEAARQREEDTENLIGGKVRDVTYHWIPAADVLSLVRAVQQKGGGLLVLNDTGLLGEEEIQRLLQDVENPVLLIRRGERHSP